MNVPLSFVLMSFEKAWIYLLLPSLEMDRAARVQILDQADCISHHASEMYKANLPPAMSK